MSTKRAIQKTHNTRTKKKQKKIFPFVSVCLFLSLFDTLNIYLFVFFCLLLICSLPKKLSFFLKSPNNWEKTPPFYIFIIPQKRETLLRKKTREEKRREERALRVVHVFSRTRGSRRKRKRHLSFGPPLNEKDDDDDDAGRERE